MRIKWQALRQLIYLKNILWSFYKDKYYWSFFAASLFGLLIYIINHFFYPSNFWNNFATDKDIDLWFCEYTDMKRLVRQPINTFTNIWYVVNAIFFLSKGFSDYKNPKSYNLITANPYYSILLGVISIYTFASSTFYHSSLISIASKLDYSAVYSISLFPLMYYTHRILLRKRNKTTQIKHPKEVKGIILVFSIIYIYLTFFVPLEFVHPLVLLFIIMTALGGFYLEKVEPNKTNKLYLSLMVITISIAVFLFKIDYEKIGCNPESFLQPHSLWHIFNSLTIFYIYLYFRSENYNSDKDLKVKKMKNKFL